MGVGTVLASHVDLDGMGSIIVAKVLNLPFDKVLMLDYEVTEKDSDEWISMLKGFETVVFADLSPSERTYNALIELGVKIEIYDHHESSSWLIGKPGVAHDLHRSGTKIFFEEYALKRIKRMAPIVREFVDLVSIYDLWELQHPLREKACDLNRIFISQTNWNATNMEVRNKVFITGQTEKLKTASTWFFTELELLQIQQTRAKEEEEVSKAKAALQVRKDARGKTFGLFQAAAKISNTCSVILEERPELDYIICLNNFKGINGKVSGRSRDGRFDCTKLKPLNGHKEAAGGTMEVSEAKQIMSGIKPCLDYYEAMEA